MHRGFRGFNNLAQQQVYQDQHPVYGLQAPPISFVHQQHQQQFQCNPWIPQNVHMHHDQHKEDDSPPPPPPSTPPSAITDAQPKKNRKKRKRRKKRGPKHRHSDIRKKKSKQEILVNKHNISATINQRYALVAYLFEFQSVSNNGSNELEFEMTVDADAFISNFTANIDGELFYGKTKPKQTANKEYNAAKDNDENAILISQPYDNIPNVFKISTNIDSKSKITLTITIEHFLQKKFNFNELTIQILKDFSHFNITADYEYITFDINITDKSGIYNINIPSNDNIKIDNRILDKLSQKYTTSGKIFSDSRSMNELVINYKIKGEQNDSTILYDKKSKTFVHVISDIITDSMININSVAEGNNDEIKQNILIPRRVMFVIDASRSMRGSKWRKTISSTITALRQLRAGYDRYGVLMFSAKTKLLTNGVMLVYRKNVNDLIQYLANEQLSSGTNINSALEQAIDMIKSDIFKNRNNNNFYMNQILLITDGAPSKGIMDTHEILLNVRKKNKLPSFNIVGDKISIFSFGIGVDSNGSSWVKDLNHSFLKILSVNNNGIYKRIKKCNTDTALGEYYDILSKPLLSNIEIEYNVINNMNTKIKNLTATKFDALYCGTDIIICGQIEGVVDNNFVNIAATISAVTAKESKQNQNGKLITITKPININKTVKFTLYDGAPNHQSNLERIWAYLKLQQLATQKLMHINEDEQKNNHMPDDGVSATDLAMKYKFVTPWTSLIVIKHKPHRQQQTAPNSSWHSSKKYAQNQQLKPAQGFNGNLKIHKSVSPPPPPSSSPPPPNRKSKRKKKRSHKHRSRDKDNKHHKHRKNKSKHDSPPPPPPPINDYSSATSYVSDGDSDDSKSIEIDNQLLRRRAISGVPMKIQKQLHGIKDKNVMSHLKLIRKKECAKTGETIKYLKECLLKEVLFASMDNNMIDEIINVMYRIGCPSDQCIIKQNEYGDAYFIIQRGAFDILHQQFDGAKYKKVGQMLAGKSFGEGSLLYSTPAAATLKATKLSIVWALDATTFVEIKQKISQKINDKTYKVVKFLKKIELFNKYPHEDLVAMAQKIEERKYHKNALIIKQGDDAKEFYLIKRGSAKAVMKMNENEKIVRKYCDGDFFGERGIFLKEKRAASILVTSTSARIYVIKSSDFARLLANPFISKKLEEKINSYDDSASLNDLKRGSIKNLIDCKLSDFENIGILGVGSFGRVSLVKSVNTQMTYSLKKIRKNKIIETHQQQHIRNERYVLSLLTSSFCVKLFAVYQDKLNIYFLMEAILGGELFTVLRWNKTFSEKTARFYTCCVVLAFQHLHTNNIIYRDLKPENLLIASNGYCKLVDFGFAKKKNNSCTLCGTPQYLSPEVIQNYSQSFAIDWWALGIFMYEMVVGYVPFDDDQDGKVKMYEKILTYEVEFPPTTKLTERVEHLISGLLEKDSNLRLGSDNNGNNGSQEIINHAWFQGLDWDDMRQQNMTPPYVPSINGANDITHFDDYPEDEYIDEKLLNDVTAYEWCEDF